MYFSPIGRFKKNYLVSCFFYLAYMCIQYIGIYRVEILINAQEQNDFQTYSILNDNDIYIQY